MRLAFDIETNGLLDQLDTVHSLVMQDVDTGEQWSLSQDDCSTGVETLMQADQIIGHNIIGFDIPALTKVYPWFSVEEDKVFDTLVASRLIWTDLKDIDFKRAKRGTLDMPMNKVGSHGLEAWGYRLGEHKGDYAKEMKDLGIDPWSSWNPQMQEYCEQDVRVTVELLKLIKSKKYSEQSLRLEHEVAWIMDQQERTGFKFDVRAAERLTATLMSRRAKLIDELQEAFPPWDTYEDFTPKVNNKKLGYEKGVTIQKVTTTVFNPGSRHHIASRLKARGWKPKEFTENGQPKVDEDVLRKLKYPEAKLLTEYLMIQKRIGMVAEGKNAWLKMVKGDRIHGRVTTNGAATGRATHSRPNVSQTTGVDKQYGVESRQCWTVGMGNKLVGVDVSGLELRVLGHYLARYDNGAYASEVVDGDVHTANQKAAGLSERSTAKRFIYAFL